MSNFYGKTTSNIVRVGDKEKFKEIINSIPASGIIKFEEGTVDGSISFYCDGIMELNIDNVLCSQEELITEIQNILLDNEFLVIKEIGYEKFNLEARAYIIHREGTDYVDFDEILQDRIEHSIYNKINL